MLLSHSIVLFVTDTQRYRLEVKINKIILVIISKQKKVNFKQFIKNITLDRAPKFVYLEH
jgi:hypothetical protein